MTFNTVQYKAQCIRKAGKRARYKILEQIYNTEQLLVISGTLPYTVHSSNLTTICSEQKCLY